MRQKDFDNGNFETPDDNEGADNNDIIPDEEVGIQDENSNKQPKVDGVETQVEDNLEHDGDDENTEDENNVEHEKKYPRAQEDNIVEARK